MARVFAITDVTEVAAVFDRRRGLELTCVRELQLDIPMRAMLGGRIEKGTLKRRHRAIGGTLTPKEGGRNLYTDYWAKRSHHRAVALTAAASSFAPRHGSCSRMPCQRIQGQCVPASAIVENEPMRHAAVSVPNAPIERPPGRVGSSRKIFLFGQRI